jgi:hypothetical protein
MLVKTLRQIKMRVTLFFMGCLMSLGVFGQDYFTLVGNAEDEYVAKRYAASVNFYKQAFKIANNNRYDMYGAACSAALAGQKQLSIQWLRQAFKNGYLNIQHVKEDSDLGALHNLNEWKLLISEMQKKVDLLEANYDKPLQRRLIKIFDDDQKYRLQSEEIGRIHGFDSKEMTALWETIEKTDSINLINVKEILDSAGWVGEDVVGPKANSALFLVIQHADLETQQKYLPLMREAVKMKKAQPNVLALLEDRVALGEKRLQIYGSQIGEDSTGQAYVLPLADPDNVDVRRAEVGLGPLKLYVKGWGIIWKPSEYKAQLPSLMRREGIND